MLLSFSLDQAKVWHDWPSSKYASVNAVFVILHHNAAARLILILRLQDHVTLALQQLHWMPIDYRITYKLCLTCTSCSPAVHHSTYPTAFKQMTWSQIFRHSSICQAEVQNLVWRAWLLLCWTHCLEQSSRPPSSNQ